MPKDTVEACVWWGDNPQAIMDLKKHADPRAKFFVEVTGSERNPKITGRLVVETVNGDRQDCPKGGVVVLDSLGFPFVLTMSAFKELYEY